MGARDASPERRPRGTRHHQLPQMAIERSAAEPPPPAAAPVRVITLNHGDHLDSTLYRFEKGCRLQFRPGPSLLGRKVFLYTNYLGIDENNGDDADLMCEQYRALEWRREEGPAGDGDGDPPGPAGDGDGDPPGPAGDPAGAGGPRLVPLGPGALVADEDLSAEVSLTRAGPFHYYFVYETACGGEKEPEGGSSGAPGRAGGSGWWQVEPTLPLPLDALCCQTVLTKCLGPLARWEAVLRVAHEAGYNAVHFTPVQELGGSGSSYSIAGQLRLDPRYGASLADLRNLLDKLRHQWNMVFICDVVLNHTANETPWLAAHPEATYNARDCPHLRPAALLDAALARLSADVARGALAGAGLPPAVTRPAQLQACRAELRRRAAALRLEECFQCDAAALQAQFEARARAALPAPGPPPPGDALRLLPDPQRRRLRATVDMALALRLYNVRSDTEGSEEARLAAGSAALRRELDALNAEAAAALADHLRAAIDNCIAGINYFRLQSDGPKIAEVSEKNPLVQPYFTWPAGWLALPPAELEARLLGDGGGAGVMAHNGWVMAADPLHDFAAPEAEGRVYLRRELIAWGDSVKLRYGASPADSPFLWAHMREYVAGVAEVFDGVRLDNCHSTPPHAAAALLRAARRARPDLYVVAELFTDADHVDNVFVNRLGITALIREALSAWDAHELGRQVHRFGGRPAGAFLARAARAAVPRVAPALLMDLTHDNPALVAKRCVFDALPTAALAAAAAGASGSTRGYDDLVPHQVDVVSEDRLYTAWSPERAPPLLAARRALNRLHARLATDGYEEIFVDQMDADTVAVTRHHPTTRHSVIVVALTAFRAPAADARHTPPPLRFDGDLHALLLEAHLQHRQGDLRAPAPGEFARHPQYINGLEEYECVLRERVPLEQSGAVAGAAREGPLTVLHFRPLRPGTVLVLEAAPRAPQAAALHALHALAPALHAGRDALHVRPALRELDLAELGALLYRCDAEERDASANASGVYDVPGHGPLVYAGLQGVASLLAEVRPTDDLGHPLCGNLRAGTWLPEYIIARLEREPTLRVVAERARAAFQPLAALPHHLRPAYFELAFAALHAEAERAAAARLARWCGGGPLGRALALASLQLVLRVPSAPLPPLAAGPARAPSLSAGLPHFATGYMRCWGRDTFVSLRGLLLLTGRAEDARAHILGFGGCLRHGLIPNLLDGGPRARYNCRDAVWWWLHAIKQYCTEVPGGHALLAEPVARLFPTDDAEPAEGAGAAPAPTQPLHDVMQEALVAHFEGRQFRERRAGPEIDAHMTERGFHVQVGVHPDTGFVFGGNDANCGTWMDKMGSSGRAGNRGRPATPRDGSAVELVALSYSAVSWLAGEHRQRRYPHAGVTRAADGGTVAWSWREWAERIQRNFERHFWVPEEPGAADARPDLVHRRGIYKDSHGASQPWADYQLRPNCAVAMAVAPELFDARHAWAALDQVERHLLGPLGLKTLDPADWNYRPDYDNADDSTDPSVAHGFNYHQGPEWTWPLGFYLRARLLFAQAAGQHARAQGRVLRALGPLAAELRASPWRGLPELTNAGGRHCPHSCRSQAWSAAAVLEVLHELRAARRARPL